MSQDVIVIGLGPIGQSVSRALTAALFDEENRSKVVHIVQDVLVDEVVQAFGRIYGPTEKIKLDIEKIKEFGREIAQANEPIVVKPSKRGKRGYNSARDRVICKERYC